MTLRTTERFASLGFLATTASLLVGSAGAQSADPAAGAHQAPPPIVFNMGSADGAGSTHAMDFIPGSGSCGNNGDQTIGWQFDVLTEITVVEMTWFDDGLNGLDLAHEVAIWDPSGNLINTTHTTIPAGTAATLDGIYRTVPITPTVLPVGPGYIVGGYNGSGQSECLSFNVTQTPIPEINFVDATFTAFGPTLERPALFSAAVNGFYGVGFQTGSGGGIGTNYCGPAIANSTNQPAVIGASGSTTAANNDVTLTCSQMPQNQFGYFLNSQTQAFVFPVPNSQGALCLGGQIGRYNGQIQNSGGAGEISVMLDLPNTPTPTGTTAIVAGQTWNFTCWYRDNNPGTTSNFSDGLSILFN